MTIGGRTIHAGDVILADNDGVSVTRPDELIHVVARTTAVKQWEQRVHGTVADKMSAEELKQFAGPIP